MIKRLDTLEVATNDLADAASAYANNFGFAVSKSSDGESVIVKVGDAEIRLRAGSSVAQQIAASGEGMIGLWLEADNLEDVVAALNKAGFPSGSIRRKSGRRILSIDPKIANQVPLLIFDRKV